MTFPPRIALMGEFNAGKSSLANLILGRAMLPTNILSSTRVPTRIYHAKRSRLTATNEEGKRERFSIQDPGKLRRRKFKFLEIGLPVPVLGQFEIIDTPGISDPTNEITYFEDTARKVDLAMWCTMANQAWRESERQAWDTLPPRLRDDGVLIVTHKDVLRSKKDEDKVLERLKREAGERFQHIVLISVTKAQKSRDKSGRITDVKLWRSSGGEDLEMRLADAVSKAASKRLRSAAHLVRSTAEKVTRARTVQSGRAEAEAPVSTVRSELMMLAGKMTDSDDVDVLLADFQQLLRSFADGELAAWLKRHVEADLAREIFSLFPGPHAPLADLIDRPDAEAVRERLILVLRQLDEEFAELVHERPGARPQPGRGLPAEVMRAVRQLAEGS